MNHSIRVGEASVEDVEAMTDIHTRARSAYYAARGVAAAELADPVAREKRRNGWARAIASPDMTALCAQDPQGRVLGALAMGPPKDADVDGSVYRQLFQIHVDPDAWGRGTGRALHSAFTGRLAAGGFGGGVLEAWEGNARARRFYVWLGWGVDGERRPGPGRADYVRMRLRLS
ncbi:GNAT family N-acetyltransferase [Streptomyces sp. NPDC048516]|uniref:GNAT family N-acetyltransferase n=1 Tax=Streptomyces sp. NPDC048516 TaxID=3365565 RepID=UPI00371857E7